VAGFARRFTQDGLQILEGIDGTPVIAKEISFDIGIVYFSNDVSFSLGREPLPQLWVRQERENQRFSEC
jgi:hypothetical protein